MCGESEERMNQRASIKRWEVAWLFTSGLVLLVLLASAAYSYIDELRLGAELREQTARAFEHPACERLIRLPVTELPDSAEVEAPCLWVVFERRYAHETDRPTQITAADIRAQPLVLRPAWGRFRARWDVLVFALALLPALYGIGLLAESAAMRRRRTTSRTDRHR